MDSLFKNTLHQEFGTWPLAYIPYGGADFGEVRAVAEAIGDGDDTAYYEAWTAAGDRLQAEADTLIIAKGHAASARAMYLRASAFFATSFHPLYGAPVDPRLLVAFRKQVAAFDHGLAIGPSPVRPVRIPCDGMDLPAYLVPAQGFEAEVRPLIILNSGYDCTITDTYFASAVAASRRGYHTLLFDGPGQGAMLYEQAVPLRSDWDVVINAVVDFALAQRIVDPDRIALSGWSLGGFLAPRGASRDTRIAALIADPGTWSIADGFRDVVVRMFGVAPEAAKDLRALDKTLIERLDTYIRSNRQLRWKVIQRGFWVHGVEDLPAYLASAELFTMEGHAERIRCPTLITMAERDTLSVSARAFFETLHCPKTLLHFTAAEGADGHCEMQNRSLLNQRVLDWLDEQFGLS